MIYMTCQDKECEFNSILMREVLRTNEEIRYGQLWAELEMPKLLNQKKRKE
jgi:hypothetical protein